jgi:hypothetical protein
MTTFTYSQARQNFAAVLNRALREGKVLVKRKDGSIFAVQHQKATESPLNVKGIRASVSSRDLVQAVRESRRR